MDLQAREWKSQQSSCLERLEKVKHINNKYLSSGNIEYLSVEKFKQNKTIKLKIKMKNKHNF